MLFFPKVTWQLDGAQTNILLLFHPSHLQARAKYLKFFLLVEMLHPALSFFFFCRGFLIQEKKKKKWREG